MEDKQSKSEDVPHTCAQEKSRMCLFFGLKRKNPKHVKRLHFANIFAISGYQYQFIV